MPVSSDPNWPSQAWSRGSLATSGVVFVHRNDLIRAEKQEAVSSLAQMVSAADERLTRGPSIE